MHASEIRIVNLGPTIPLPIKVKRARLSPGALGLYMLLATYPAGISEDELFRELNTESRPMTHDQVRDLPYELRASNLI